MEEHVLLDLPGRLLQSPTAPTPHDVALVVTDTAAVVVSPMLRRELHRWPRGSVSAAAAAEWPHAVAVVGGGGKGRVVVQLGAKADMLAVLHALPPPTTVDPASPVPTPARAPPLTSHESFARSARATERWEAVAAAEATAKARAEAFARDVAHRRAHRMATLTKRHAAIRKDTAVADAFATKRSTAARAAEEYDVARAAQWEASLGAVRDAAHDGALGQLHDAQDTAAATLGAALRATLSGGTPRSASAETADGRRQEIFADIRAAMAGGAGAHGRQELLASIHDIVGDHAATAAAVRTAQRVGPTPTRTRASSINRSASDLMPVVPGPVPESPMPRTPESAAAPAAPLAPEPEPAREVRPPQLLRMRQDWKELRQADGAVVYLNVLTQRVTANINETVFAPPAVQPPSPVAPVPAPVPDTVAPPVAAAAPQGSPVAPEPVPQPTPASAPSARPKSPVPTAAVPARTPAQASPANSADIADGAIKDGWKKSSDPKTKRPFFIEIATKKTTWKIAETPFGQAERTSPPAAAPEIADGTIKDGWKKSSDKGSGRAFFIEIATKKTTWKIEETPFSKAVSTASTPTVESNPSDIADGTVKDGWKKSSDPKTKRPFFIEIATKKTTWKIAETPFGSSAPGPKVIVDGTVKDGWKKSSDKGSGRAFFIEIATKKTTWKIEETPFSS